MRIGGVKHILLFIILVSALLAAISLGQQPAPASLEKLVKGPIVQNVQRDRATLVWVTRRVVGSVKTAGAKSALPLDEPVFHSTEMTGLQPGVQYQYSLSRLGPNARGSFTTAPKDAVPFTFIVYGDTRTRHDVHQSVANKIFSEKPSFVMHTGDLVANGLSPGDWDRFFDISKELLRNIPFYPVPGNHERNAPVFFKYFSFPEGNTHYYSFDWGGVHIVGLNSNDVGDTPKAREAFSQSEIDWLKQDLSRNTKELTFVFMHHPLHTAVQSRRASAAKLAARFEPVLLEGRVTAVFAGHDHNYQHHIKEGLHYIVTGGGGAPLYDVIPIPDITVKTVKVENYVRVKIAGNKAQLEAVDLQGNPIESFELEGKGKSAPQGLKVAGF